MVHIILSYLIVKITIYFVQKTNALIPLEPAANALNLCGNTFF